MRYRLPFLLFLVLLTIMAQAQQPSGRIASKMTGQSFAAFSESVYRQSGSMIFDPMATAEKLKVTIADDSLTVLQMVLKSVEGTNIMVSPWHQHFVLLPGKMLIQSLPPYQKLTSVLSTADSSGKVPAKARYLEGRAPEVVQTIRVGAEGPAKSSGRARIQGRITDKDSGEAVFGATLFFPDLGIGAVTDEKGLASIQLRPGKHLMRAEYLGYERKNFLLEVRNDGNFNINLARTAIQMEEFVVFGDKQMNMKSKDPGLDKIVMKSIKELPMMMGERDVLKISGTLPGIVSTGEGASGINVRGGGSDQNAFYINRIPVYNTSHLFGFFPAFNAEIIRDFAIYKGHVPAEYGGRLSSVFNITTREGNKKHLMVRGGLSPITGNLVVEGPVVKDVASVLLSARSSYSDWMLQRIEDPSIRSSAAHFNDFAGGVNATLGKTKISAFGYRSFDRFRLADVNDYHYINQGVSLIGERMVTDNLRAELSLIGSSYSFELTDKQYAATAYQHRYQNNHYEARLDFKHLAFENHTFDYGLGMIVYQLRRGIIEPYGMASLRQEVDLGNEKGVESSFYFADNWEPNPRLTVTAGLRMSLFTPLGPKDVLTYADGLPRDLRYVVDTLSFANNKILRWYLEPDIRLSVNYSTDENGAVKLAFNQMHQNLFLLNNTVSVSPSAQWKLADYYLRPSAVNQVSVGVFRNLRQWGLETSLELYYKKTTHFPEFRDGADFISTPHVETTVLQGEQQAYGLEFFLKRNNRKLDGWLSYTYSRSLIRVDDVNPLNDINNGKLYPSNHDIPHMVNLVMNYHLRRRVTFSTIVTYQRGRPVTFPVSAYFVNGVPMLDYSDRNAYRIPDYFRTDLSLTLEGNLKKDKLIHSSLVISVYNLTGRDNPYSVFFKNEDGKINSYQYAVIGVPILTATWIFKLGNYAAE